jgi:hypothetical protein
MKCGFNPAKVNRPRPNAVSAEASRIGRSTLTESVAGALVVSTVNPNFAGSRPIAAAANSSGT